MNLNKMQAMELIADLSKIIIQFHILILSQNQLKFSIIQRHF